MGAVKPGGGAPGQAPPILHWMTQSNKRGDNLCSDQLEPVISEIDRQIAIDSCVNNPSLQTAPPSQHSETVQTFQEKYFETKPKYFPQTGAYCISAEAEADVDVDVTGGAGALLPGSLLEWVGRSYSKQPLLPRDSGQDWPHQSLLPWLHLQLCSLQLVSNPTH